MPGRNVLSSSQQSHSRPRRRPRRASPVATASSVSLSQCSVSQQSSVASHHVQCCTSSASATHLGLHPPRHRTGAFLLATTAPAMRPLRPLRMALFTLVLAHASWMLLCDQLPSSPLPMAAAFELNHLLKSSGPSGGTVPSSAASTTEATTSVITSDRLNASLARLLSREARRQPAAPQLPSSLPLKRDPFTILAILPEENAPLISTALRDAQSRWEVSGHASAFATDPATGAISSKSFSRSSTRDMPPIRASDIPLVVYSEPANNDTERILTSVCEWISVHNPVMVLSLLDRERNFYVAMVAQAAGIPFVSLTQSYRNEINALGDDHQLEIDFKQATQSLFDRFPPPPPPQEEPIFSQFHSPYQDSLMLSLDPPIQTLADATFELLRAQYWFDAILIVDDSIVSDLFARRLSALCRNGNGNGHESDGRNKRRQSEHSAEDQRRLDDPLYGDSYAWSNFKRNSLKKSPHRTNTLNSMDDGEYMQSDEARAEEMHRRAVNYDDFYETRKSKEASLLDVWKNLVVIRLSRSLNQTEFYLRMAEIQTTHRRVVLVHCDWDTTQRVIGTAGELDLFNGDNIWILLDGLLDGQPNIFEPNSKEQVDLPNGMLALRNRRRLIYDANLLDSIVELAGKAALNTYRNQLYFASQATSSGTFHSSSQLRQPFKLPPSASSPLSPAASAASSSSSSSSLYSAPQSPSSPLTGCTAGNSTDAEREHRLNILRELRNLVEPVLSRYRWNRRKPCSSLRSSAKARVPRQRSSFERTRASAHDVNHYNDEPEAQQPPLPGESDASQEADELESRIGASDLYRWIVPEFEILNLVPQKSDSSRSEWRPVGNITVDQSTVNTILYIGADQIPDYISYDGLDEPFGADSRPPMYMTNSGKHRFRVATNIAPPFVIESTKLDNNTCLTGDFCLKIDTNRRDELIAIFTDFRSQRRLYEGKKYLVKCCAGIAIDLLNAVARDLHFDYDLYMVADGLFGVNKDGKWDGIVADLVNDVAHLSFTAFSTTSSRVKAIDFSVPFFYSGVSCLSASSNETDVPLLAFLIPFSYELWAAIFASLFATAVAAAIYEWFSPFGLNPWGRQRTKNFSLASALWVMCSLLFSHLVAFKAPKSWPNKVLINVWGAFSVIFLATYTANIAAHFAGLFLVPEVNDFHDTSLMKQRTGTARSSASEGYLMEKYTDLWHYIGHYKVDSFDEGLEHLRAGKLDVLIGDTAILDYFRATDPGCQLRLLGDSIFDDAYAVGLQKGFPFRDSISNLILKYNEYGFLDQLHRKWYGRVHCLESSSLTKPMPLTVRAEAGVFLMLAFGICVGIVILFAEHFVFKYILPALRKKNKDCFWKSPNLMFFSQKLYRFINTVELVSPHHSAKEIITNLKEGQIASLFQKSVKRKAKEEARRRKSKSQFFELMQEARKIVRQKKEGSQQQDEDDTVDLEDLDIDEEAALNTDANIRATRPSFSLSKDNSLLDSDSEPVANRVSAIRFKDPEYYDEKRKNKKSHQAAVEANKKLVSKLKNSGLDTRRRLGDMSSSMSYSNETDDSGRSRDNRSCDEAKQRRETLKKSHLSSTSFSLENIFFEGLLSEGVSGPPKDTTRRRRIYSFEDLPAIKKELSESSNENGHYDAGYGYESSRITPPQMYRANELATVHYPAGKAANGHQQFRLPKSTTTPSDLAGTSSSLGPSLPRPSTSLTQAMDQMGNRMSLFSRADIIDMWRSREREMITELNDVLAQKKALEQKVALLQKMLKKPP